MEWIVAIASYLSFFCYWGTDGYWPAWAWVMFCGILFVGTMLWKKGAPLPAALLLAWFSLSAWVLVEFKPALEKPGIELGQILTLKNLASSTWIELAVFSASFGLGWKRLRGPLSTAFYVFGIFHAISLFYDQVVLQIVTGTDYIGLMGNRSIGASFSVVWVFFCFHFADNYKAWEELEKLPDLGKFIRWSSLLGIVAMLVSHSGISYAAFLLGGTCFLLLVIPELWIGTAILLILGLALGGYVKPEWGKHVPRFDAWPMFFAFWRQHFFAAIGSGLGTFKFWGPASQQFANFQVGKWWIWAHNDWFQVMYETGAIGLALSLYFFGWLVWKARQRIALFSSLVAFGVVMLGNYPWHIAPFVLFGWYLIFETMIGGENAFSFGSAETEVCGNGEARQDVEDGVRQMELRDAEGPITRKSYAEHLGEEFGQKYGRPPENL